MVTKHAMGVDKAHNGVSKHIKLIKPYHYTCNVGPTQIDVQVRMLENSRNQSIHAELD